jgi:hypothetical protein
MGSSGVVGGGSGQRNNVIDDLKLKRRGEMMGGGVSRLAQNDGEGEVKGNRVD